MKFEAGKEYKTRGGQTARIYALDGAAVFSIHGAIKENEGWRLVVWQQNGRSTRTGEDHLQDLVEGKGRSFSYEAWVSPESIQPSDDVIYAKLVRLNEPWLNGKKVTITVEEIL